MVFTACKTAPSRCSIASRRPGGVNGWTSSQFLFRNSAAAVDAASRSSSSVRCSCVGLTASVSRGVFELVERRTLRVVGLNDVSDPFDRPFSQARPAFGADLREVRFRLRGLVPSLSSRSSIGAFSHSLISRSMRRSTIRWATDFRSASCGIKWK